MTDEHGWRPLIDDHRQPRLLALVQEIITGVVADASDDASDLAAAATLLAYAARVELRADAEELAAARLDQMVAAVVAQPGSAGLWGGIAGVAWTLAHLAGGDEVDEACVHLDGILEGALEREAWTGDYDLISGLAGIGVAALERIEAPSARRVAGRVLDHLEATAREEAAGLAWFTPPARLPDWQRAQCPDGYYNLGLAHGIPGVVGLMAGFVTAGFETARSRRLLDGAVRWLRATTPVRTPARFAAWAGAGIDDEPARLAWCYGDPGVAVTLLAAARALDDAALEAEAVAMGHAMAARPLDDCGVADMGICHGAAGVAHIFNRMYQATGDPVLGDAARSWIERLLAMRRDGEPVGGFPARRLRDDQPAWEPDAGILMGASGVALVLLAAATDLEPGWDRTLLVNVTR